jgi:hypothetical protein
VTGVNTLIYDTQTDAKCHDFGSCLMPSHLIFGSSWWKVWHFYPKSDPKLVLFTVIETYPLLLNL